MLKWHGCFIAFFRLGGGRGEEGIIGVESEGMKERRWWGVKEAIWQRGKKEALEWTHEVQ